MLFSVSDSALHSFPQTSANHICMIYLNILPKFCTLKKGHSYKHTSNKANPLNDFSVKELTLCLFIEPIVAFSHQRVLCWNNINNDVLRTTQTQGSDC